MPQLHQLPERAAHIFDTWIGPAERDVRTTAELLGMTTSQVSGVMGRWGFHELARDIDKERVQSRAMRARMILAEGLPRAAQTVLDATSNTTDHTGKMRPGSVTPTALKASLATLGVFGISPLTRSQIAFLGDVDSVADAAVSDADVAAALARDDRAWLIAAAAGAPLPALHDGGDAVPDPVPGMPPRDFTSAQLGGRVGSDPSPLHADLGTDDVVEASYREMTPAQWDAEQRRGEALDRLDFSFGEQPENDGEPLSG